jgi:pantothenate kinase
VTAAAHLVEELARELCREVLLKLEANGRGRVMLGIAGAPGSGKSTLAELLADQLAEQLGRLADRQPDAEPCVAVVPMDGFHLGNAIIEGTALKARKGALDTFDVGGYVALLRRLARRDEPVVYAPAYRRGLEEPIAASIAVPASVPVVITEGNYLLVDQPYWRDVPGLLDEVWYVETPEELRRERLVQRHVRFGMTRQAAELWADGPDEANARLITSTRARADRIIPWC